ncbi:hypothetical protein ACJX0J_037896, partial [Zea mays]
MNIEDILIYKKEYFGTLLQTKNHLCLTNHQQASLQDPIVHVLFIDIKHLQTPSVVAYRLYPPNDHGGPYFFLWHASNLELDSRHVPFLSFFFDSNILDGSK